MVVGGGTPVGTPTIETGSYAGTGTYNSSKPNSITFNGVPAYLCIVRENQYPRYFGILFPQIAQGVVFSSEYMYSVNVSVSGNTVSWYSSRNVNEQLNENDQNYKYFALTI